MVKHLTKPLKSGRPKGSARFDPESAEAFGEVVRVWRVKKGISQEALAGLASIDRSFMGRIERGETTPTLTLMLKLARALGVSATTLIRDAERILGEEEESEGS
jgi:Predicted transcription factor, homolog of eukaryotic MBF1